MVNTKVIRENSRASESQAKSEVPDLLASSNTQMLELNCSYNLGFDDSKVLKEQITILTYVQVCIITRLKYNYELIL